MLVWIKYCLTRSNEMRLKYKALEDLDVKGDYVWVASSLVTKQKLKDVIANEMMLAKIVNIIPATSAAEYTDIYYLPFGEDCGDLSKEQWYERMDAAIKSITEYISSQE